jgi:hypothetical protein
LRAEERADAAEGFFGNQILRTVGDGEEAGTGGESVAVRDAMRATRESATGVPSEATFQTVGAPDSGALGSETGMGGAATTQQSVAGADDFIPSGQH